MQQAGWLAGGPFPPPFHSILQYIGTYLRVSLLCLIWAWVLDSEPEIGSSPEYFLPLFDQSWFSPGEESVGKG